MDTNSPQAIFGAKFEEKLINQFNHENVDFQDVRNIKKYWADDIDFIVSGKNGKKIMVEAKTTLFDKPQNKNISLGTSASGCSGWFWRTKCDVLVFGISQRNKIYIFNFKKFKDAVITAYKAKDMEFFSKFEEEYVTINPYDMKIDGIPGIENTDFCMSIPWEIPEGISLYDIIVQMCGE